MADSEMPMNVSDKEDPEETSYGYILRCRGLPYSVAADDLKKFFSACNIASVYLAQGQDGRANGEAFLEMEDEESFDAGLKMNKEHIGKRYIEVFESDKQEMGYQMKKYTQSSSGAEGVIRLRGLPFSCDKEDIINFFKDFQLVEDGIVLVQQHDGRASGEGFVQLESINHVEDALKLNNGHIGHRYVELFPSSIDEMRRHTHSFSGGESEGGGSFFSSRTFRPTLYDRPGSGPSRGGRGGRRDERGRGGFSGRGRGSYRQDYYKGYDEPDYDDYDYEGEYDYQSSYRHDMGEGGDMAAYPVRGAPSQRGGHLVRMRGLPFSASEDDIYQFFYPYVPSGIYIKYDTSSRASGEAEVHFSTHGDAKAVMTKDRQCIGRRYIELFLDSNQESHGSFQSTRGRSAPHTGAYGRSSTMTGAYSLPPNNYP